MDYGSLVPSAFGDSCFFLDFTTYNLMSDVNVQLHFVYCRFRFDFRCAHSDMSVGRSCTCTCDVSILFRYFHWLIKIHLAFGNLDILSSSLHYLWRSLVRNSIFRVVLGLSSLKGSGALIASHPTRWTFLVDPISGCWPLG